MEGAERNEVLARALVGLRGVSQKQRLISLVTSLGWLVTHVRCSGALGRGRGGEVRLWWDEMQGIPLPESCLLVPVTTPSELFRTLSSPLPHI